LATISILRIFWKEIAEAHHQGNMDKMQRLYQKTTRILYFIGAFIAGALIPWSAEILDITVGDEYIDGKITFMIMLVYPVHQSMGQIGGAVLFATEKVKLQTIIGSVFMITSILVAYFVLAPSDAVIPGFNLASEGLAWKMVVLQFIQVNILAYVIARVFN
jgi:O-antigen/teichoic acid export membrane protein